LGGRGILKFVAICEKREGRRQRHGREGNISVGGIMYSVTYLIQLAED